MRKCLYTGQTKKIIRQYHKTSPTHKMLLFYSCKQQFHPFFLCILWHGTLLWCHIHLNLVSLKIFYSLSFENTTAHNGIINISKAKKNLLYNVNCFRTKQKAFPIQYKASLWCLEYNNEIGILLSTYWFNNCYICLVFFRVYFLPLLLRGLA